MIGNRLVLKDLPAKSGWCDKDQALLYACFQLLVDFLEKEKPETIIDFKHDQEHRREWAELQALYRYWKVDRPKQEKKIKELLMGWAKYHRKHPKGKLTTFVVTKGKETQANKALKALHDAEDRFYGQEETMLLRLIKIRRRLWC